MADTRKERMKELIKDKTPEELEQNYATMMRSLDAGYNYLRTSLALTHQEMMSGEFPHRVFEQKLVEMSQSDLLATVTGCIILKKYIVQIGGEIDQMAALLGLEGK